jgi:hypothetical protein
MSVNFRFEAAPKAKRARQADPQERAAADMLRENPGTEARVLEYDAPNTARQITTQINRGDRAAFPSGFRAKSREIDGKGVIYITYVGHQA